MEYVNSEICKQNCRKRLKTELPGDKEMISSKKHEYVFSAPFCTNLSFAVWLIDDYTQKEPLGKTRVSLKEENIKAVKNLSGYYTFSGLRNGIYTLAVDPELYFPEEKIVDTSLYSKLKEPVIEILLRPRPLYSFPDRATLLRGMLDTGSLSLEELKTDITLKLIPKKEQKKAGLEVAGAPDERGEFVLYFRDNIKGKNDFILWIKGRGIEKKLPEVVEEGKSTSAGLIPIF